MPNPRNRPMAAPSPSVLTYTARLIAAFDRADAESTDAWAALGRVHSGDGDALDHLALHVARLAIRAHAEVDEAPPTVRRAYAHAARLLGR